MVSKLHHPSVVELVGACWNPPNLCIVLEFMDRGGLDTLLRDPEEANHLTWHTPKLQMLMSIAHALVRTGRSSVKMLLFFSLPVLLGYGVSHFTFLVHVTDLCPWC